MNRPKIVSRQEWLKARQKLLKKEKDLTHRKDELAAERRRLPWVKVEKDYFFEGPQGRRTLAELFDGRSQLIVYHFMFGPDWVEGCPSCSFLCDHVDGTLVHLAARDVSFAAVSRAPYDKIQAFRQRMGWKFNWVSSFGSDFNFDYQVSFNQEELAKGRVVYNYEPQGFGADEAPGTSVFYRDEKGEVFHTYSSFARGGDLLLGTYNYLDLVPKGRDEEGLAFSMAWVRHHDRYGEGYRVDSTAEYRPPATSKVG